MQGILVLGCATARASASSRACPHDRIELSAHAVAGPVSTSVASVPREDEAIPLAEAIDAWSSARSWVNELTVPADDTRAVVPAAHAASVTLRLAGRVVGFGEALDRSPGMLARATTRALRDALDDDRLRDLPDDVRRQIGRRMVLELEIAGAPVPLLGDTIAEASQRVRPGLDGIAMRRGDRFAYAWPGRMQAFRQARRIDLVMIRLLRTLDLPPRELAELRRNDRLSVFRVPVVRFGQEAADRPPFESHRGTTLANGPGVDPGRLADLSRTIVERLATCSTVGPSADARFADASADAAPSRALGLQGAYDAWFDRFEELAAPPAAQALVAWSLARWSRSSLPLEEDERRRARAHARALLDALAEVDAIESDPMTDPLAPALIVLASVALDDLASLAEPISEDDLGAMRGDHDDELREERVVIDRLPARARALLIADAGGDRSPTVAVLRAAAIASLRATGDRLDRSDEDAAAFTRATVEDAWTRAPSAALVGVLPWLIDADRAAFPRFDGSPPRPRARGVAALEAALAFQLGRGEAVRAIGPVPADLAGAFALGSLTPRVRGDVASLRILRALAATLRDGGDSLSPETRNSWRAALDDGLRFLDQLRVRPAERGALPNPPRALGGIRRAPGERLLDPADAALALLAIIEAAHADDP